MNPYARKGGGGPALDSAGIGKVSTDPTPKEARCFGYEEEESTPRRNQGKKKGNRAYDCRTRVKEGIRPGRGEEKASNIN